MESPLELPIFIHYRPSRHVVAVTTLIHAGALFCLFLAQLPVIVGGALGTIVLLHYGCYLGRALFPTQRCFKLDRYDRWQLLRAGQEATELRLLPGAFVHPRLVALCFRESAGRPHSCVLTHDNLDEQTLRRLRVRLRWAAGSSTVS